MCGIAGFITSGSVIDATKAQTRTWLMAMTEHLAHRGPDGQGIWVEGPVALGHRRLAIIDLESGGQPMLDADSRAVVTFNGEIYNFRELKKDLEEQGYTFKTHSDTEVLLNAYLARGTACLDLFEGMFSFALWDREKRLLFVARDRFGKKPFYYTLQNGIFAFASELGALRHLPFLKMEVETSQLARFLAYEYVPTPETIYKDIFKLQPGHYLIWEDGELHIAPYWDLPLPDEEESRSEEDLCEHLRFLLCQAVKRRLVSDVPLGVFLSGGIDSSTVAALMAGMVPKVETFSIGFQEPSYDESSYARLITQRYNTSHHERVLDAAQCGELLPVIVARQDEPLADPSIVPTFLLSELTRKHVTVALGGDGSDELFAGYEHYPGFKLAEIFLRIPGFLQKGVIKLLDHVLPMSTGYTNPRLVAKVFLAGIKNPRWLRVQTWLSAFSPEIQESLWENPDPAILRRDNLFAPTKLLYEGCPASNPLARVFYVDARQFLLDDILMKVDRCSMMHSLEVRAPFLDKDVAEFVCRLPVSLKLQGYRRKYLLKKAVGNLLPRRNIYRPKRGFLIPTALWLKDVLRPLVEELLGERWLKAQGLFRPDLVRRLLNEHFSGQMDHRKRIWTLLVLQLWLYYHRPSMPSSG